MALLCATYKEMACLLPLLEEKVDEEHTGGMRLVEGRIGGHHVLILSVGVGKVPAAAGTRFLVDRYRPRTLIVCGTAGALSPEVRIGDMVIATELVPGDVGVAHSGGFSPTGPGLYDEGRLVFCPSFIPPPDLVERARSAAEAAGLPCHAGRVLTCDQVAAVEGIPFVVARAVSDELSHDFVGLEKALEYRGQSRRNLWEQRFQLTVTDPSALGRARELLQGRDLALERMASFLRAFLAAGG